MGRVGLIVSLRFIIDSFKVKMKIFVYSGFFVALYSLEVSLFPLQ